MLKLPDFVTLCVQLNSSSFIEPDQKAGILLSYSPVRDQSSLVMFWCHISYSLRSKCKGDGVRGGASEGRSCKKRAGRGMGKRGGRVTDNWSSSIAIFYFLMCNVFCILSNRVIWDTVCENMPLTSHQESSIISSTALWIVLSIQKQ